MNDTIIKTDLTGIVRFENGEQRELWNLAQEFMRAANITGYLAEQPKNTLDNAEVEVIIQYDAGPLFTMLFDLSQEGLNRNVPSILFFLYNPDDREKPLEVSYYVACTPVGRTASDPIMNQDLIDTLKDLAGNKGYMISLTSHHSMVDPGMIEHLEISSSGNEEELMSFAKFVGDLDNRVRTYYEVSSI